MVVTFQLFVGMGVIGFLLTVNMGVGMTVAVGIGMDEIPMGVCMGMNVGVLMGMLEGNRVFDEKGSSCKHDGKAKPEWKSGPFPQKKHTQCGTQEWGDGIVGAGFGSP